MNKQDAIKRCIKAASEMTKSEWCIAHPEGETMPKTLEVMEALFDYCLARNFPSTEVLFSKNCELQGVARDGRSANLGYEAFRAMAQIVAPLIDRKQEDTPEPQPTGARPPEQLKKQGKAGDRIGNRAAEPKEEKAKEEKAKAPEPKAEPKGKAKAS